MHMDAQGEGETVGAHGDPASGPTRSSVQQVSSAPPSKQSSSAQPEHAVAAGPQHQQQQKGAPGSATGMGDGGGAKETDAEACREELRRSGVVRKEPGDTWKTFSERHYDVVKKRIQAELHLAPEQVPDKSRVYSWLGTLWRTCPDPPAPPVPTPDPASAKQQAPSGHVEELGPPPTERERRGNMIAEGMKQWSNFKRSNWYRVKQEMTREAGGVVPDKSAIAGRISQLYRGSVAPRKVPASVAKKNNTSQGQTNTWLSYVADHAKEAAEQLAAAKGGQEASLDEICDRVAQSWKANKEATASSVRAFSSPSVTAAPAAGHSGKVKAKKPSAPANAPKRPRASFAFFIMDNSAQVGADTLLTEGTGARSSVLKKLGKMWQAMTPQEKQVYKDKAATDQKRYRKEKKAFERRVLAQEDMDETGDSLERDEMGPEVAPSIDEGYDADDWDEFYGGKKRSFEGRKRLPSQPVARAPSEASTVPQESPSFGSIPAAQELPAPYLPDSGQWPPTQDASLHGEAVDGVVATSETRSALKVLKDDPGKPMAAFAFFVRGNQAEAEGAVQKESVEGQRAGAKAVLKQLVLKWNALTPEEQKPYEVLADADVSYRSVGGRRASASSASSDEHMRADASGNRSSAGHYRQHQSSSAHGTMVTRSMAARRTYGPGNERKRRVWSPSSSVSSHSSDDESSKISPALALAPAPAVALVPPAIAPKKVTKSHKRKAPGPKRQVQAGSKAPKRPRPSFNFWMTENMGKVRQQMIDAGGESTPQAVMQKLSEIWRAMTQEQRQVYVDMQDDDTRRYRQELADAATTAANTSSAVPQAPAAPVAPVPEAAAGVVPPLELTPAESRVAKELAQRIRQRSRDLFCTANRAGVRSRLHQIGHPTDSNSVKKKLGDIFRLLTDDDRNKYVRMAVAEVADRVKDTPGYSALIPAAANFAMDLAGLVPRRGRRPRRTDVSDLEPALLDFLDQDEVLDDEASGAEDEYYATPGAAANAAAPHAAATTNNGDETASDEGV